MHEIALHVAQIVNIEQLQQHPRNMVHLRHIIVNTPHKGNNNNNNNIIIIIIIIIKSKSMHGQFYRDLERPLVDKEKSLTWLCSSGIKGETETDNSSLRSSTSIRVIRRK